jgi:hypothetical protein
MDSSSAIARGLEHVVIDAPENGPTALIECVDLDSITES